MTPNGVTIRLNLSFFFFQHGHGRVAYHNVRLGLHSCYNKVLCICVRASATTMRLIGGCQPKLAVVKRYLGIRVFRHY